jgi:hypothetical protein
MPIKSCDAEVMNSADVHKHPLGDALSLNMFWRGSSVVDLLSVICKSWGLSPHIAKINEKNSTCINNQMLSLKLSVFL